jgi:hypothetical protein
MANEIVYRGKLAYQKGDADSFDFGDLTATMTGSKALRGRQTVTTTPEALVCGEVPPGRAWFICKNMDATNTLVIASGVGAPALIEVLPGETSGPFRFQNVTTPQVASVAGTIDFIYLLVSA